MEKYAHNHLKAELLRNFKFFITNDCYFNALMVQLYTDRLDYKRISRQEKLKGRFIRYEYNKS